MVHLISKVAGLASVAIALSYHTVTACNVNGVSSRDGTFQTKTIGNRSFLLWIPSSYNPSSGNYYPLILSYHGAAASSCSQAQLDQLANPFFNKDALVAYPQGQDSVWQGAPGVGSDDTGFTNVLACDPKLSVRIAAFAPIAGAFYQPNGSSGNCNPDSVVIRCNPGRTNVPILQIHGGADNVIAYGGGARRGECLPTIPHYVRTWAGFDNLGASNASRALTNQATVYEFGSGDKKGLVTHVYAGDRVGHSWMATIPNNDNGMNGDGPASFNATRQVMDFFGKWYLR